MPRYGNVRIHRDAGRSMRLNSNAACMFMVARLWVAGDRSVHGYCIG